MFDFFTKTTKTKKNKPVEQKPEQTTQKGAQRASLNFNQSAESNSAGGIKIFYPRSLISFKLTIAGLPIIKLSIISETSSKERG